MPSEKPRPLARFRYNAAIAIAGIVAFFGAVPLATSRAYLLPILLVPVSVAVWGWRTGTDALPEGLRVRALFGSRLIRWPEIDGVVPGTDRRVYAVLTAGRRVRLPAVRADDLPRLSAAAPQDAPPPTTTAP